MNWDERQPATNGVISKKKGQLSCLYTGRAVSSTPDIMASRALLSLGASSVLARWEGRKERRRDDAEEKMATPGG